MTNKNGIPAKKGRKAAPAPKNGAKKVVVSKKAAPKRKPKVRVRVAPAPKPRLWARLLAFLGWKR